MPTERLVQAQAFMEELANTPPQLPYEPDLMPQLFAATRENSSISVEGLTALIERSQKLATRILTLANSACYAMQSSVTSLKRAVSLLGFNEVRSLVVLVGASSATVAGPLPLDFDPKALWCHQILTGTLAKAITACLRATAAGQPGLQIEPDEAYTAGLLHDIGKFFLATSRPEVWQGIQALAQEKAYSFAEAELAYWGMDHCMIGAQVLHFWRLPLLLTDSISWHHAPALAPTFAMEAGILAAADQLAHSGLSPEGAVPASVLELLPAGVDPVLLALAVQKAFADNKADTLSGILG